MARRICDLADAGSATADLLVSSIFEAQLLEHIPAAYEDFCKDALSRFGVEPRQLAPDDFKRIFFEVVCFAVFVAIVQEAPKCFEQDAAGRTTDPEDLQTFDSALFGQLEEHLSEQRVNLLEEVTVVSVTPTMQFGRGENLQAAKRLDAYASCATMLNAAEEFGHYLCFAIDPQHVILVSVWMRYTELIVDITRLVLERVSSEWKAVQKEITTAVQAHQRGDYGTVFPMFKSLAENGHVASQFHLSGMYRLGQGVTRDDCSAMLWLEKAARGGYPEAQLVLGMSYALGDRVQQNDKEAAYWLGKAADQELPKAQFSLGCLYNEGRGVARDTEKAVTWWNRAVDHGSREAQLMLGMHEGRTEAFFASLEDSHGSNYQAMINRVYDGFARASRGSVMLLPAELAGALDEARQDPSRETWARLKAAMLLSEE